jgi:alpha-mannosidase
LLHKIRWTPQKITQRIKLISPLVYRQRHPLPPFRYSALSSAAEVPTIEPDFDDNIWEKIEPGHHWGAWDTNFVLRTRFSIPQNWSDEHDIALYLPLGEAGDFIHPEALAYIDGKPYASADRFHHEIVLPTELADGQPHYLSLHGWTGLGGFRTRNPDSGLLMGACALVQIDAPTRAFVTAAAAALDIASKLDENNPIQSRLYNALDAAFQVLDTRDPLGTPDFFASIPAALETLRTGIQLAGPPLDVDIIGIGHAHIDVAWLWNLDQTIHKSGRTFSNVLRLMERYPEYRFSQSQPQLYQFVEQHYPDIFEQIKQRIREGRWEVMGGTWVEPDCNAIGAESLARQFVLGRNYFRRHFGDTETPVLWLPDTFGYSWALPQLIKQAGMKYFITHKMSWNQYNHMPNQMMWWQGLDGTRILTYFLTTPSGDRSLPHATTYNSRASVEEVFGTWNNFVQKETHNELIMVYGYGDGGGGPTSGMIENLRELTDHPGAPRVRPGTVREFMERIETQIADKLPVWNGEFYFEYHRGTYTSQGRTKRNNRKSEFLLHDAEFLATWAALVTDRAYPVEELSKAWELLCLNQFHDILPGSSIGAVYVDSDRDYRHITDLGQNIVDESLRALAKLHGHDTSVLAANPTSFGGNRTGLLVPSLGSGVRLVDESGNVLVTQQAHDGTLVEICGMKPYSIVALREVPGQSPSPESLLRASQESGRTVLENDLLIVEISGCGDITRIFDKEANREVLAPDANANVFLAFEDRPLDFDAWDIDIFYEDRTERLDKVDSIDVTEYGPLRLAVDIKRRYRSSTVHQKIYLCRNSRRIDFDTWIDWHEQHTLLKVSFPVNVMSPVATYDVQWGNVQRPTHRNTSWDWARFETCAYKWADLSEGNYGVALLNDCKHGYDIRDNTLRLTLLKSATHPDPNADQGEHQMVYSLLPHRGDWRNEVEFAAYDLNDPLILRHLAGEASAIRDLGSLITVSEPNVIIETIKRAEDGNGVIVRLFENHRNRNKVLLTAGFEISRAYLCNLLELDETELEFRDGQVSLDITPYQIINLRLIPRILSTDNPENGEEA